MTNQVFYQDSYVNEIETCIDAIDLINGCTAIAPEENIFHIQGGGQPNDHGEVIISGVRYQIKSLIKKKDQTFILLDCEIPSSEDLWGESMKCFLDWNRRYTLMRYHTCGHVLMSSAKQVISDYEPKGMEIQDNLSYGEITFSTQKEITNEQSIQILDIAKYAINNNLSIEVKNYSGLEAAKNDNDYFRVDSALKLKGKIRVVTIDGFDANPCGGTHVKSLAEIGTCIIQSTEYNTTNSEASIKFMVS
jgi:Ser-tRNA(Ala) deacylase AlaX